MGIRVGGQWLLAPQILGPVDEAAQFGSATEAALFWIEFGPLAGQPHFEPIPRNSALRGKRGADLLLAARVFGK